MPIDTLSDPRPISQRLREDNWDLHERAEHDTLPQHMVRGTLPKDVYVQLLGQLFLANRALDEAIVARRATTPVLNTMVTDMQLQTPYLEADLRHFGVNPASLTHKPATATFIKEVAVYAGSEPLKLFGLHYVREGANNGNKFVAMKLKKAWGVEGRDGFHYLDPYGEGQRPLWERFKRDLDKIEFTEAEKQAVVAAARSMFEHMIALHKEFPLPPVPDAPPRSPAMSPATH